VTSLETKPQGRMPGALDAAKDLGRSFKLWYERITLSFVFASTWWALGFVAAQLALANPLLLIPAVFLLAAASCMAMCMANGPVHKEDFDVRSFFRSFAKFYLRFLGLFFMSAVALLLYIPLMLYLPTIPGILTYLAFGVATWVGLFSFVTAAYAAGIIVERDERLFSAIKKGFLLMIDNPGYSLASGALMLLLAFAGYLLPLASMAWSSWAYLVLVIIGVFLYGTVNAYFLAIAVRRLLSRYGLDRKSGREEMQEELAGSGKGNLRGR